VNDGAMGNGYIAADIYRRFSVSAMDDHRILDIYIIADADVVDISPDNCIEPDTAIIADDHIPDDCRILGKETPLSDIRDNPFDRSDQWHGSWY